MNTWLVRMVHESNGRLFTPDEMNRISNYVEFLAESVAAVKKLDENQKWLIRHLSDVMGTKAVEWGLPKDPFTNDFAAFLAAIGHAVLSEDLDVLEETVIKPCESLADALEIPRAELALMFQEAWRILTPRLDPPSENRLRRFFERPIERLQANAAQDVDYALHRNSNMIEVNS
jgi:hypothetical protein